MSIRDNCKSAVAEHTRAKLPKRILRLASAANADLYFGPFGTFCLDCEGNPPGVERSSREPCSCVRDATHPGDYPGWCAVLDILREATKDVGTLYVDEDSGCVCESEPEAELYCDEGEDPEHEHGESCCIEPGPYYAFERSDILKATFGSELGSYL